MITITSTNPDPQAIKDVFAQKGITPLAPVTPEKPVATDEKPTGDTPVEGQEHSGSDPAKGAKPEAEPEKPTQETTEKPKEEAEKSKSKGGWQAKVEKLTAQAERLRDDLEAERGGKSKLQAQLDAVNAELAALKPKKEDAKPEGPVRPKRPTRAEFEFDEEKYEAAMADYETKSDEYTQAVAKKTLEDGIAALKDEQSKNEASKAEQARIDAFAERMKTGKEGLDDFEELLAEIPKGHQGLLDKSQTANNYVLRKAKNPAALLHFLMKDYVEDGEKEAKRLEDLDDYDLVIELRAIEDRLSKPVTATLESEKPKVETPAKPQPKPKQAVPDAPIEPVGGRHQPSVISLEDQVEAASKAGNITLFRKLREQQRAAKQPARVA